MTAHLKNRKFLNVTYVITMTSLGEFIYLVSVGSPHLFVKKIILNLKSVCSYLSNQNSIGIPQSAAAAFPTRILIEILEEFLNHLMYWPLKFNNPNFTLSVRTPSDDHIFLVKFFNYLDEN